jgi:ABC-type Zn uptake system ZnuABC Zn-binding protein ZnuA
MYGERYKAIGILMLSVCMLALVGCGNAASVGTGVAQAAPGTKRVLATFTIIADMAREVAGDKLVVESITKIGTEIHDYEPTPSDIVRAQDADLVLNNGLGLERWFEKFMGALSDVKTVDVSEGVTPIPIAEGSYKDKPNPHAWMSLRNARIYVENIRKALVELDPANADTYNANAAAYLAKFQPLEDQLTQALAMLPADQRGLVSCEGAFSYFARDAGMQEIYLWPINADQEGTPDQVRNVIEQIRARNIPVVFCESTVNTIPMEMVASETGAQFGGSLYVDSLTKPDGDAPTYLAMLKTNVDTITRAYQTVQ